MSQVAAAQAETQNRLAEAITAGALPGAVQDRALELQADLEAPTRLSLLGLPRVGKTAVLNLLAGAQVVPEGCDLGTVQLVHGPVERTVLTLPDRENVTLDRLPTPAALAGLYPALTRIEAPLPALGRISLMKLGQAYDHEGQRRAIRWAVKQSDIMIWCTEAFSSVEQALWQTVPDHMHDHSVLLRTRMDMTRGERDGIVSALRGQAGDAFRHVLGVSAHEARAARTAETVDKDRMRAAGGTKLISTLLRQIERGRQHLIDEADVLLLKYGSAEPKPARARPKSAEAAATRKETPPERPTEAATEPADTAASNTAPDTSRQVFHAAIEHLGKVGRTLEANTDAAPRVVLDRSAATLDWMRDHLDSADLGTTGLAAHLRQMTQDAEDLVQLMRIEQTAETDTDAVLLLLQLKRGFQAALAA